MTVDELQGKVKGGNLKEVSGQMDEQLREEG